MKNIHLNNTINCDKFNTLLLDNNNQLLLKYNMDDCGFCDELHPKWQALTQELKKDRYLKHLVVANINSDFLQHVNTPFVSRFPTI